MRHLPYWTRQLNLSDVNLTDVQLQLQRDLNSTAMWTKEHGMVAHPEKTKYMIIGTRQKLAVKNVH